MLTNRLQLKDFALKLLIVCGLIGLIFSKAEGVSLLPFPDSEDAGLSNIYLTTVGNADNQYSYSQTVKRTSAVKSHKGKSQNFGPLADNAGFIFRAEPADLLSYNDSLIISHIVTVSSQLAGSTGTRGPPPAIW